MAIGGAVKRCWDRIQFRKDFWEQDQKKKLWAVTERHVIKNRWVEKKAPTNEIDKNMAKYKRQYD